MASEQNATPESIILRPIPGRGWPTSAYSLNVSLVVDGRTLIVTDEAGQPHHLRIGDEPGEVLGLAFSDVILEPGTERQRTVRCVVAADIDNEPLLALMPTDRWPTAGLWAEAHGFFPIRRKGTGPLLATPRTLVVGKPRRNLWVWVMLWYVAAVFWLFSPLFWDVPRWAAMAPLGVPIALLVIIGTPRTNKARRAEEAQKAAWEPLIRAQKQVIRPRKRRQRGEAGSRGLGDIVLRPSPTAVLRRDSYGRNVSLAVDGRTLIATDETGHRHAFPLGNGPGEVRHLDICTWTTAEGPERTRRTDDYLVGVDTDNTAVFAIAAVGRWDTKELMAWADIHEFRLLYAKAATRGNKPKQAEDTPTMSPRTLVIGTHRRTYLWVLFLVGWWTLGILWLAGVIANNASGDPFIPGWIGYGPLLAALVATIVLLWWEGRSDRARKQRLTAWRVLASRQD